MKKFITLFIFCAISFSAHGQEYMGAGHSKDIKVSSSSSTYPSQAIKTIDGSGLGIDMKQASRFLGFATMGADYETIEQVSQLGVSNWLDQQFNMPQQVSFTDTTWMIWNHFKPLYIQKWGLDVVKNASDAVIPYWYYWKMAWWNNVLKADDQLRQKSAQALSQIFVISEKSNLQLSGPGMAHYYDMLYKHAFGNYKDLLHDVAMHPMMGFYLSHINNPKSNEALNIHPDENFAREIMQLFSIGLYELNIDGTRKQDAKGNDKASYDNNDIKEFAKIFTGLNPPAYYWPWQDLKDVKVNWNSKYNKRPSTTLNWAPMSINEEYHEPGEKHLLNGFTVPASQSTENDIKDAIDNLFNHPNVGPFIGKLLIQRFVKSNPSPAYVTRVAMAFNNNGNGVRGDMKAVIRAILTDTEALNCSASQDPKSGKLREPLLRYTQAMMAFNAKNQSGKLWNWGFQFDRAVSQGILASPSVFNFYLPNYQPIGPIADSGLVAPEYQLHTTATSVNYMNLAYQWFINKNLAEVSVVPSKVKMNAPGYDKDQLTPENEIKFDLSDEIALANNPDVLIDRLDLILTGGQLSNDTKAAIKNTINQIDDIEYKVRSALYLIFISPDYLVQK